MTNYQAILAMSTEHMESFLDQVYLAGLNTGGYAARLEEERQTELLDINPFDMAWLCAPAEAALISLEDEYILNALTEAIFRVLVQSPPEDKADQDLADAVECALLDMEAERQLAHNDSEISIPREELLEKSSATDEQLETVDVEIEEDPCRRSVKLAVQKRNTISDKLWGELVGEQNHLLKQQKRIFLTFQKMTDAMLQGQITDPDEIHEIFLELAVFGDHYAPARDLFREVSLKIIHRQPPFCALESVWVKSIREAAIQMSEGENHP